MVSADAILESSVVGSFSNIGYRVRSRDWDSSVPRMDGATAVITGATSGIGLAAAERMADVGARVVLVGRNPAKLEAAAARVDDRSSHPPSVYRADLSSLDSVRRLASELISREHRLDVLVNNASVLAGERTRTGDGFELTLATNLLGPFLLTNLLIPRMVRSAPARIITVSSGGMYTEPLDVPGLEMEAASYRGAAAYARTKRAQVVLTELWAERLHDTGVVAHSMHPGWVNTPGVASSLPTFHRLTGPLLRSVDQGADTIVWLATADEALGSSGRFWLDRRPRSTHRLKRTAAGDAQRDRLWDYLCEATGWEPSEAWPMAEVH
jgi:NAD(P)-dependent dehydrogenase (short-subunit alcohol dehydrogenase family)